MKIKTADLTDAALDWAVKECKLASGYISIAMFNEAPALFKNESLYCGETWFNPSTNWAQGGPIINEERIEITPWGVDGAWRARDFHEPSPGVPCSEEFGPTPLIAAMRCFVAAKLGKFVIVPDEFCAPAAVASEATIEPKTPRRLRP